MNIKLLLYFLALFLPLFSYGQRYYQGNSFNASAGVLKNGFGISAGLEKFIGEDSSIAGDIDFLYKNQSVVNSSTKANMQNYIVSAKYRQYISLSYDATFFPFVSLGAFGGYDAFSNAEKMPPSVYIERKSGPIYGIRPEIGLEYNMSSYSYTVTVIPLYEFRHKEFITSFNIGFKYYF